jgi:hypothetical protein
MAKDTGTTKDAWDGLKGVELVRFALQAGKNLAQGRSLGGQLMMNWTWQERGKNSMELERLLNQALKDPLLAVGGLDAAAIIAPPAPQVLVPASDAPPVEGEAPPTLPPADFQPSADERRAATLEADPELPVEPVAA